MPNGMSFLEFMLLMSGFVLYAYSIFGGSIFTLCLGV